MIKRNGSKKIELDGIQAINTGIKLILLVGALWAFTHSTLSGIEEHFDDVEQKINDTNSHVEKHCSKIARNEQDIQRLMED